MKNKAKKYFNSKTMYKLEPFKPIIYKTIFSLSIILFVLLLQNLNFKSTQWIVGKIKHATEYEINIKANSLKLYDKAKDLVKYSKDQIPVFNMNSIEKYASPIEGEIYKSYEEDGNKGIDIKSIDGKDPKAIFEGEVKDVYLQEKQGYFVTIQKDDTEVTYGYLSKSYVSEGEVVDIETPIGVLGTNKDENKYLRIELKIDGQYENPLDYIELK